MIRHTKAQQRREARYRKALKAAGFRSWTRANARRGVLIDRSIDRELNTDETRELQLLHKLADLYVTWKTNDGMGPALRRLARLKQEVLNL